MPLGDPKIFIGYDDPETYLPDEIRELSNSTLTPPRIFL